MRSVCPSTCVSYHYPQHIHLRKDLLIQGHSDVDSQDKARGFRTTLRPGMGAGRNIGGGPGGEANGF